MYRAVSSLEQAHVVLSLKKTSAISILTDFLCAALPVLVIRTLQMRKSLKIGLSVLMGLGVL